MKTRILHIVGARPQFIKYLIVSEAIETFNKESECIINNLVHTGQHYDYEMSDVFFEELGMRNPDYCLNVGSLTHGKQTAQIIQGVEEILLKEKPDAVLVYGDTNSTVGGALAAAKLHIPVAHVEAGLRSFNKYMPEELNRLITDHSSTILFCPSNAAIENLVSEGFRNIYNNGVLVSSDCISGANNISDFKVSKNKPLVINVGDVMYDVLLNSIEIADKKSEILNELKLTEKEYYLLTLHRAENIDREEIFEKIVMFVNQVSQGKTVIFPMHPRTRKTYINVTAKFNDNVKIIEPQRYFDMIKLLKNCLTILTDSGGMQKEAFWLKVPCITLREQTEWVETVLSGWNILYEDYEGSHKPLDKFELCYGDGKAADRITNLVCKMGK